MEKAGKPSGKDGPTSAADQKNVLRAFSEILKGNEIIAGKLGRSEMLWLKSLTVDSRRRLDSINLRSR